MNQSLSRSFAIITIGIFSLVGIPAAGAAPSEPLELEPRLLVTATRSPGNLTGASGSVTVITRAEIEQSVAEDLVDLLRLQAGVDAVRSGGPGAQTSVFMRGTNSNHVLVLVDGMRVASPHTGAFAWEQLPLNQVERVEIVRGPRASLYGSDAIGGVIQVFTRESAQRYLRLTAGSHRSGELEAGLGLATSRARLSVNAAYRDTGGYSAQNESGFSFDPDDDGFNSRNVGINGSTDADGGTLSYLLLARDNESEFDQGMSAARQALAAVAWSGAVSPAWEYRLQAGYIDDELESDFGFFTTAFISRKLDLGWQNQVSLAHGDLIFGLDYLDEAGDAASSYDASRSNAGVYALWDRPLGHGGLQFSGRLDDNSEFGTEMTWQAALNFDLGDHGSLGGLAGTAFRAPSLSEQFSPGFGGLFGGNPHLEPESSETLEFVYRRRIGREALLSLSVYRTDVNDLIAFAGQDFRAINIHQAEIRGAEMAIEKTGVNWQLRATATLQDTEDRSTGLALLRRPERKATVVINRTFGNGAWFGAELFVSGERLDFSGPPLPGYGLLNLRGGLRVAERLVLELRLDNLLDADYAPATGFNGAGRAAFLSLGWRTSQRR